MSGFWKSVKGLLVALVLLAIGAAFAAVAVLFFGLNQWIVDSGGWGKFDDYSDAELLVDRLTDAGIGAATIDPADPLLARRVILVTEGMNERTARYVASRLIHLNDLDPSATIDLRLATSGGWLDAAFVIIDTMRSIEAPVDVTAIGGCYSAGTVVLAAATGERRVTPGTMLSIHVNDYDPIDEYDADGHELARFRDVYERYTNVPVEWLEPRRGDNQYYLDAQQALDMGLVDEITKPQWEAPPKPAPAARKPPAAA